MTDTHLIAAGELLGDCFQLFLEYTEQIPDMLDEARAHYDAVPTGDPVRDATIAIGRSTIAALALRAAIEEGDDTCGWDPEDEGLPLGGLAEFDEDDGTRALAEEAARAARAAYDADAEDPLVPLQLGDALAWLGDEDGAKLAYYEALRRDPSDKVALYCLSRLGERVPAGRAQGRSHGFALVLEERMVTNSDTAIDRRCFPDVATACRAAEHVIAEQIRHGLTMEEISGLELVLETYLPEADPTMIDVVATIPGGPGDPVSRPVWPDLPTWAPDKAMPVGRIVRLMERNWFPWAVPE